MKRSPLKRRIPLRPRRSRRAAKQTQVDSAYLAAVRLLPCCAPSSLAMALVLEFRGTTEAIDHLGPVHAHHAGRKPGTALKAQDNTAIPLCNKHHRAWHDTNGVFRGWTKAQRRYWADAAIQDTRRLITGGADE